MNTFLMLHTFEKKERRKNMAPSTSDSQPTKMCQKHKLVHSYSAIVDVNITQREVS